jgi:hypothetical protein
MTDKKYTARKATGVSVEDFYAAQDAALKVDALGKRTNMLRYSCLVLARVDPMPSYDEFREMLDDEINALVNECKKQNPRHFDEPAALVDEKKSET